MSKGDAHLWGLLHEKLDLLRRTGQARAALRTAETLVALSRRAYGADSLQLAQALTQLSNLEIEREMIEQAENHLREAVHILERIDPPARVLLAQSAGQLGLLLSNRGEIVAARDLYVRSVELTAAEEGSESATLAALLNNAALLYQATGDLGEAEMRFRQAGAIYDKLHGAENDHTATVLHNLGNLLVQLERYGDARSTLEKAAEIRASMLERDDTTLAQTLAALAVAHHGLGALEEARKLYERTMRIFQKNLPEMTHDYRTTGDNLTALLRSVGQARQADSLQNQVRKHTARA